ACGTDAARGLGQQRGPGRTGPLRSTGAEVGAEISQARRGQQSVTGGVGGDVAVGVPGESGDAGPVQPGDAAWPALVVRVDVGPDPDPRLSHVRSLAGRAPDGPGVLTGPR